MCDDFRNRIFSSKFTSDSVGEALQEIFNVLSNDNVDDGESSKLICRQIAQRMDLSTRIQQDAEEFFLRLVESVDNSIILDHDQAELPSKAFDLRLQQTIDCVHINYKKQRTQKYLDLSVDIPFDTSLPPFELYNLSTAVGKAFEAESLQGSGQVRIKDHGLQDAHKTLRIEQIPTILVIHIKRFAYDAQSGQMAKIMTPMSFPRQLDLSPYTVLPPNSTTLPLGRYELNAVVVHEGWRLDFGHYYTLAREKGDAAKEAGWESRSGVERWVQLNDHSVTSGISAEQVDLLASKGSYLLFYSLN